MNPRFHRVRQQPIVLDGPLLDRLLLDKLVDGPLPDRPLLSDLVS